MIQDLSDKVWSNPRFHTTAKAVEAAWLRRELGINTESLVTENIAARAMEAAAILACSRQLERRRAAHRVATCAFELFEKSDLPFDAALRVVLARLSNFPAMITKKEIDDSISTLPWVFALEELVAADRTTIQINNRLVRLTNYQRRLWDSLQRKQSVALSAPTSAGKSFILQLYISSIFANGAPSVVYIVPTRALISQVAREIDELFRKEGQVVPEIVTVPLRSGADPPSSSIYVMTQERVHLSLESNPLLHATLLVVDEAHSIAEGSRGILLHSVIDQLLRRNPTAQVLFASPTTRNLSLFGELFALEVERRPSREPTVSQNFLFVSSNSPAKGHVAISATDGTRQPISIGEIQTGLALSSRIDRLAHLPDKLCARQPNLVYANGADEAEEIALRIARTRENREPTARLLALRTLSAESVHRKYILGECVIKGVGFHYSNIPTVVRHEIEAAFASGDLDCLVCTSTLLQGVNLPAKNIFMLKPTRGRDSPMESPDFWNLSGRAGRLMREFQGNIFLIDYHSWSRKPLSGPKDTEIASAIETTVRFRQEELANVIAGAEGGRFRRRPIDLDSAFVRLLSDLRDGSLRQTFERIGLPASERAELTAALESAGAAISLPDEVLRRTPSVSPHKQQRLYRRLKGLIDHQPSTIQNLIPLHPRDENAYGSYADALGLCHELILGLDPARGLHRFHALMAMQWMQGWSLPRIIGDRLRRRPKANPRIIIRNTLELIETQIRFQTLRLFGCYNAVLEFALQQAGERQLSDHIPDVELFLEVGASNQTMISFISLGLSRAAAVRLSGAREEDEPELEIEDALEWLRRQDLDALGLSPLLRAEVDALLEKLRPRSN